MSNNDQGRALFSAYVSHTTALANATAALCERVERLVEVEKAHTEELRALRASQNMLQQQIGALVAVIAQQNGIPTSAIMPPHPDPRGFLGDLVQGALEGAINRTRFGG